MVSDEEKMLIFKFCIFAMLMLYWNDIICRTASGFFFLILYILQCYLDLFSLDIYH